MNANSKICCSGFGFQTVCTRNYALMSRTSSFVPRWSSSSGLGKHVLFWRLSACGRWCVHFLLSESTGSLTYRGCGCYNHLQSYYLIVIIAGSLHL